MIVSEMWWHSLGEIPDDVSEDAKRMSALMNLITPLLMEHLDAYVEEGITAQAMVEMAASVGVAVVLTGIKNVLPPDFHAQALAHLRSVVDAGDLWWLKAKLSPEAQAKLREAAA